MKIIKIITFLFCIVGTIGCKKDSKGSSTTKEVQKVLADDEISPNPELNISLIRLIANPEKYHGKRIQVIGYLNLQFEGNAIYSHEEDYKRALTNNAFWVTFSENTSQKNLENYNKKYVIAIGTFNMNKKGHSEAFGGALENISRLDTWNVDK